ncbi:MAG: diacylglycerol kinase family protein [Thermodesulfobacteriota bacterium]
MNRTDRDVVLVNPAARGAPADLAQTLRVRFPGARVWATQGPGHATELARRALAEGVDPEGRVVACGGDGTFREVATAVGSERCLGLLPTGTVNLVAAELGIPQGLDDALAVLAHGEPVPIYPGVADTQNGSTLFFIGVSAGPDADAVHGVGRLGKKWLGRYAYAAAFAKRLATPVRADVRWECEGRRGACGQFIAVRMPRYGGRYRISQTCSLFAPGLEALCVDGARWGVLRFFWSVLRSDPRPARGVERWKVSEMRVELPAHGRVQVDGDALIAQTLRLRAACEPVHVIGPAGFPPGRTGPRSGVAVSRSAVDSAGSRR